MSLILAGRRRTYVLVLFGGRADAAVAAAGRARPDTVGHPGGRLVVALRLGKVFAHRALGATLFVVDSRGGAG